MKNVGQHKQMAMGSKAQVSVPSRTAAFARGGRVGGVQPANMKTGLPTSPLTDAKRANGVPGIKRGGKVGC